MMHDDKRYEITNALGTRIGDKDVSEMTEQDLINVAEEVADQITDESAHEVSPVEVLAVWVKEGPF